MVGHQVLVLSIEVRILAPQHRNLELMPLKSVPFYVYIVACADGTLYTGVTNNIERRLEQHNGIRKGGAKYTKGKGPVNLVYSKQYKNRSDACKREYEIKHTLSRGEKEILIVRAQKSTG